MYIVGPLTAMLRDLVIAKLGRNKEQSVVDEAKRRFLDFYNGQPLSADLRDPVCILIYMYSNNIKTQVIEP